MNADTHHDAGNIMKQEREMVGLGEGRPSVAGMFSSDIYVKER